MNIANGSQKVTDPHPNVSIFNFHYCIPPDAVAENYGLNKVIGENETGFRGQADVLYRTEGWDFLLAGGNYNNLDYSFTPGHPAGTLRDYKSPGGGSRELRDQLRILRNSSTVLTSCGCGPLRISYARSRLNSSHASSPNAAKRTQSIFTCPCRKTRRTCSRLWATRSRPRCFSICLVVYMRPLG